MTLDNQKGDAPPHDDSDEHINIISHDTAAQSSDDEADMESRIPCSLIVRNVPTDVFQDDEVKEEFTAHITQYAPPKNIIFLKSFRRVRFDYATPLEAYHVRTRLAMFIFRGEILHVYFIQPEQNNQPNPGLTSGARSGLTQRDSTTSFEGSATSGDESDVDPTEQNRTSGMIPTRQVPIAEPQKLFPPQPERVWLISPPASPPMHWQQIRESKPKPGIEVEILSKIAELKPGDTHELIPPTINTPQICVHVCEETETNNSNSTHLSAPRLADTRGRKPKTKIIQTRRPPMRWNDNTSNEISWANELISSCNLRFAVI